ncbi:hypothetical protein JCM11641_004959 [Rhodosporidiobolus odoratus]
MSYRQNTRAPVSYNDLDSQRDCRPAPPSSRSAYYDRDRDDDHSSDTRGEYDRGYSGRGSGHGRDRDGRDGYERRRSRSPTRRRGEDDYDSGRRGGRYDDDDGYRRRDDRHRDRRPSPPPPRSSRRSPSPSSSSRRSPPPPRGRHDTRSPSPPPRGKGSGKGKASAGAANAEDAIVTADAAAEVEEQDIAALMGFGGFGTTQGKQHDTQVSGAQVKEDRKYRQYMNRKGGFNRPLDKIR